MKHLPSPLISAAVLAVVMAATALTLPARAQSVPPHRVVFEMTSDASPAWESLLNNVENVRKALGPDATEVRVIAHGKGIGMMLKTNTALAARMAGVMNPRVKFFGCENTMRRLNISRDDLQPGVGTVDSGVAEVVRLQEAGWSYLKSGS